MAMNRKSVYYPLKFIVRRKLHGLDASYQIIAAFATEHAAFDYASHCFGEGAGNYEIAERRFPNKYKLLRTYE